MSRDLRPFFERYAERYMAGDAEGVAAEIYEAPFLAVRGGSPIHLANRAAVVSHLEQVMGAYRDSGAAVAEVGGLDVIEQGDSAALATVRWIIRSQTGDVLKDFRTSYQLVGPDPWRVLSYVNHDTVRS